MPEYTTTEYAAPTEYDVEITIPGQADWCLDTRKALLEFIDRLAESPERQALCIMPAVWVNQAEDEAELWELCLSYVAIPGNSLAVGVNRALGVTEQLFGSKTLATVPAMRTLAWEH